MEIPKKNILITGGSGYIGAITALYILKNSDLSPVIIDVAPEKRSKKVLEGFGIPIFKGDIADKNVIQEIYKKYPFKLVMHFAAFIEAGESVINPKKYFDNNVKNFEIFLETLKPLNIENFIFSSSAAVYGTHESAIEEDFAKKPESPYGETKLQGEAILEKFSKENKIKVTSLRYFNAAGAHEEGLLGEDHEPETHLIPRIMKAIQNHEPIRIFGSDYSTKDGTCVRDYIHVTDLAAGHLKALEFTIKRTEPRHEAFNLGSGKGFSILEVVKEFESILGFEIEKKFQERRAGDPAFLVASVNKAKEVLGWSAAYDLKFILKTAWDYHKKTYGIKLQNIHNNLYQSQFFYEKNLIFLLEFKQNILMEQKISKNSRLEYIQAQFQKVYGAPPTIITYAPGRIEFIGNHTDYNEGIVLGASIDRAVWVALRLVNEPDMTFYSELTKSKLKVPLDKMVKQEGDNSWVNYPLGVWTSMAAFNLRQPGGFEYFAFSDLPTGAGLSSSAAIELATGLAYLNATNQTIDRDILVKLCRYAENNFVGVPCGYLDQMVSGFGKENHLVYIDCRGPKASTVVLPEGVNFWIFNTHTKHALVDSLYSTRHTECMEAAKLLNVKALADVSATEIDKIDKLPLPFRLRAKHVVEEIERVEKVMAALEKSDIKQVGELLTASHRSSQHQFENSTAELDFLVDNLVSMPHVHGTRLTGGGFGGAVLAVVDSNFTEKEADQVSTSYREKFGKEVDVLYTKTGPGAHVVLLLLGEKQGI